MMKTLQARLEDDQQVYIFAVLGVICIVFHEQLTDIMPHIIGLFLVLTGLINIIFHFINKESRISLGTSFIYLVGGGAVVATHHESIVILGIMWALLSLLEVAEEIDEMVAHQEFSLFHTIMIIISTALAVMLLTDPFEKFAEHMVILGLEMITTAYVKAHHLLTIKFTEAYEKYDEIMAQRKKDEENS